jgi:hypothetical protein
MFELESELPLVVDGTSSLAFLQAVYRSPDQPLSVRMKAAGLAIPYEFPKLAVTAVVQQNGDFAERLDRARARSAAVMASRPMIEHAPQTVERPTVGPEPTPMSAPFQRLRRI